MSASSRAKALLSEQGKNLLAQAASGVPVDHNEILAKLSSSSMTKKTKDAKMWTEEEDNMLRRALERYGEDWTLVVQDVPGRNKLQCVQRWKKTLKPGLIKGPWKPEEDALLIQVMAEETKGDWQAVSRRIAGRNAKQCKERWLLNLNPEINHGAWSAEEDAALVQLHLELGGKWSLLAKQLPGRTEHSIKTRFLSLQRQAAKARGWTIEEDRTILKEFMLAPNLDGCNGAIKALTGRTKKQVKQRWLHLRKHYVSIDDLATSSARGGVSLTEQDLKMLIPHSTFSQSGEMMSSYLHASSSNASSVNMNSLSSNGALMGRKKSLARHQGSSNPSQPFRHMAKKLEKSEGSSSSMNSKVMIGGDLLNAAYGSTSSMSMDPMSSTIMHSNGSETVSGVDPFVIGLEKSLSISSLGVGMNKFASSSSNSSSALRQEPRHLSGFSGPIFSKQGNLVDGSNHSEYENSINMSSIGGAKSLQNAGFSSFLIPPLFPPSPELNGSSSGSHPTQVARADSFLTIGNELDQMGQHGTRQQAQPYMFMGGQGKSMPSQYRTKESFDISSSSESSPSPPPPPPPPQMDRSMYPPHAPAQYPYFGEEHTKPDDVMRAFSNFAPEISGGNVPPVPLQHHHSLFDSLLNVSNASQRQFQQQTAFSPPYGAEATANPGMLRMDSGSFLDFTNSAVPEEDSHSSQAFPASNARRLRKFASSAAAAANGVDDIEVFESMFGGSETNT